MSITIYLPLNISSTDLKPFVVINSTLPFISSKYVTYKREKYSPPNKIENAQHNSPLMPI